MPIFYFSSEFQLLFLSISFWVRSCFSFSGRLLWNVNNNFGILLIPITYFNNSSLDRKKFCRDSLLLLPPTLVVLRTAYNGEKIDHFTLKTSTILGQELRGLGWPWSPFKTYTISFASSLTFQNWLQAETRQTHSGVYRVAPTTKNRQI